MFAANTIGKFSLLFIPYLLISFIVSNLAAFTIAAALVYWFVLGPTYLMFVLALAIWSAKYRREPPRYSLRWLGIGLFNQLIMILASPSSCFGMKQGNACYSFLQTQLTNANFTTIENAPAHWTGVEILFPIAAVLHLVAIAVFLSKIRSSRNNQA